MLPWLSLTGRLREIRAMPSVQQCDDDDRDHRKESKSPQPTNPAIQPITTMPVSSHQGHLNYARNKGVTIRDSSHRRGDPRHGVPAEVTPLSSRKFS